MKGAGKNSLLGGNILEIYWKNSEGSGVLWSKQEPKRLPRKLKKFLSKINVIGTIRFNEQGGLV